MLVTPHITTASVMTGTRTATTRITAEVLPHQADIPEHIAGMLMTVMLQMIVETLVSNLLLRLRTIGHLRSEESGPVLLNRKRILQ
jgi:hypothetical protein